MQVYSFYIYVTCICNLKCDERSFKNLKLQRGSYNISLEKSLEKQEFWFNFFLTLIIIEGNVEGGKRKICTRNIPFFVENMLEF